MDKNIRTKAIIPAIWEEIPPCHCGQCVKEKCHRAGCKNEATIAVYMTAGFLYACKECFRDHLVCAEDRWKVDATNMVKGGDA